MQNLRNSQARLESILKQLIPRLPAGIPKQLFNIGCGNFPEAEVLRRLFPGWQHIGIDLDNESLKRADKFLVRIQADGANLPFRKQFKCGFLLIRHPDVDRLPDGWRAVFKKLPDYVAPGGMAVITAYSLSEYAFIRRYFSWQGKFVNEKRLPPVSLRGEDKFISIYARPSTV